MAYIVKGPVYGAFQKQPLAANGVTTQFALDYAVGSAASILVSSAGVIQEPNVAYTIGNSGNRVDFTSAPISNTYIIYLGKQFLVPTQQGYECALEQFVGDGATTTFTLTNNPVVNSGLIVYVDGIQQSYGPGKNYTLSGMDIIFTSAPANLIDIDVYILARERVAYDSVSDGVITWPKLASTINGSVAQWQVVSTNTSAVAGKWYMVDTFPGTVNVTLPANPLVGDTFKIMDHSGTFAVNNCSVLRNGKKINGVTEDLILNLNNGNVELRFTGNTNGWRVIV